MWQFGTTLGISIDGVDATATVATPGNCPGISLMQTSIPGEAVYFRAERTMPSGAERQALRDLAESLTV